jgi:hypothetical protein
VFLFICELKIGFWTGEESSQVQKIGAEEKNK